MKIEFFRQIFQNPQVLNFIKKFVQWEMSCSMRTDGTKTGRHDEVKSRFLRFCEIRIKLQANLGDDI
jgi:hypothetical protein